MIGGLSTTELFVIMIIVLLLFGAGRVQRIGGELGGAIREFRKGLRGDGEGENKAPSEEKPKL